MLLELMGAEAGAAGLGPWRRRFARLIDGQRLDIADIALDLTGKTKLSISINASSSVQIVFYIKGKVKPSERYNNEIIEQMLLDSADKDPHALSLLVTNAMNSALHRAKEMAQNNV